MIEVNGRYAVSGTEVGDAATRGSATATEEYEKGVGDSRAWFAASGTTSCNPSACMFAAKCPRYQDRYNGAASSTHARLCRQVQCPVLTQRVCDQDANTIDLDDPQLWKGCLPRGGGDDGTDMSMLEEAFWLGGLCPFVKQVCASNDARVVSPARRVCYGLAAQRFALHS
eukprot:3245758-Rhodomonas_salina.3